MAWRELDGNDELEIRNTIVKKKPEWCTNLPAYFELQQRTPSQGLVCMSVLQLIRSVCSLESLLMSRSK